MTRQQKHQMKKKFNGLLSYTTFPEEKVLSSKNIRTQIQVTVFPFRGLLYETQGAGLHVSRLKILIRNKRSLKQLFKKKN